MKGEFEFYASVIGSLRGELILLSAFLFFLGLLSAPFVVEREIKPLLCYPRWMWHRIQHWIKPDDHFLKLTLIICFLNATSLLANILSGLFIFLPFVFGFLVGLHVGVIVIEETGKRSLIGILLNPVAFLELPATWISLSIGMELGLFLLNRLSLAEALPLFRRGLLVYGALILPLLLVGALTEVSLIKWGLKLAKKREDGEHSGSADGEK